MPPSGFNQNAINGLLVFVEQTYRRVLDKYDASSLDQEPVLGRAISELEAQVQMHSSGVGSLGTPSGINGLSTFVTENFRDLVKEIQTGKKKPDYALQAELEHIRQYLTGFKI